MLYSVLSVLIELFYGLVTALSLPEFSRQDPIDQNETKRSKTTDDIKTISISKYEAELAVKGPAYHGVSGNIIVSRGSPLDTCEKGILQHFAIYFLCSVSPLMYVSMEYSVVLPEGSNNTYVSPVITNKHARQGEACLR